ncbi:hypothetical protein Ddye_023921 [Dipteronia dyeriana]|uniref:Uncharacterized protein n=1 Tax=Dipteronia dyeriana TaxID=168575 RepID=A0AAD9TUV8_9ROSI|nr:hypothetical protein Ddye_023921 [Dipteronia dyeriana]
MHLRESVYEICEFPWGCSEFDVLTAFDDANADWVHIIAFGATYADLSDFAYDSATIGAFHAMENCILTTAPANNYGPEPATASVVVPWILSVAASYTDRLFIGNAVLGNGTTLIDAAVNPFGLTGEKFPVQYGKTNLHPSYTWDENSSTHSLDVDLIR